MSRFQDISDAEREQIEAMKAEPEDGEEVKVEDEAEEGQEFVTEEEGDGPARGPDGKFVSKKAKAEESDEAEDEPETDEGEETETEKAEDAPEEDDVKKRMVPVQARDAERHKRQEAESEVATLREQLQALQSQIEALKQPQKPAQEQAQERPPDQIVDPDGYNAWLEKRLEAVQRPYQEIQQRAMQAQAQQREIATLTDYTSKHEAAFRQEYPDHDYDGALAHAMEQVADGFRMMGYPDAEIPNLVREQQIATAKMAFERGINPAAYVYNYAVRTGYRPKASEPEEQPSNIARLADVQKRTRSTASAGGSARSDEVTAESLAKMSEGEFAKLMEKNPEAVRRALGG